MNISKNQIKRVWVFHIWSAVWGSILGAVYTIPLMCWLNEWKSHPGWGILRGWKFHFVLSCLVVTVVIDQRYHSSLPRFEKLIDILLSEDGAHIELAWSRFLCCLCCLRTAATRLKRDLQFPHLRPSLICHSPWRCSEVSFAPSFLPSYVEVMGASACHFLPEINGHASCSEFEAAARRFHRLCSQIVLASDLRQMMKTWRRACARMTHYCRCRGTWDWKSIHASI